MKKFYPKLLFYNYSKKPIQLIIVIELFNYSFNEPPYWGMHDMWITNFFMHFCRELKTCSQSVIILSQSQWFIEALMTDFWIGYF